MIFHSSHQLLLSRSSSKLKKTLYKSPINLKSTIRLEQLTGLRFFAALLVFASHLNWSNSHSVFQIIFSSGYVGVSFFFILSGFVLSLSYESKISNGALSFKRYILLRLARLSPLHFATAFAFIIFGIFEGTLNILPALANLTYLQSWVPHTSMYFSLNAPSWSLSNEMFFYFLFFFLIALSPCRLVKFTIALSLVVLIAACVVTFFIDGEKLLGSNKTFAHWMFYIFPGFRLLEFMVGMVMFRVWRDGFSLHRFFTPISYILLFLCMYLAESVSEPFRMSLFFLPAISLFLYAHLSDNTYVSKFYSSKSLVLLGNASFAFYLIHVPLITIIRNILASYTIDDFSFFILSFAVISFLSIGTHLTYEKWAERKLKNYVTKLTIY